MKVNSVKKRQNILTNRFIEIRERFHAIALTWFNHVSNYLEYYFHDLQFEHNVLAELNI